MRDTQREGETGRGRSRLSAGSLIQDSIPRLRDHNLAEGRCSTMELPGIPERERESERERILSRQSPAQGLISRS